MATKPPLAFLSYAHQDDVHEGGKLRKFAERLSGEVRLHSGEEFPIFVDRSDVKWGQEWQERIEESLSGATFLIPILTPGYFKSDWCRKEFLRFLDRERALKRRDLILSVYYVRCPLLEDPSKRSQDELAQILRDRQYKDCRNLRHMAWTEPEVTRQFENMALEVVAALERPDAPPPAVAQVGAEFTNRLSGARSPETSARNPSPAPTHSGILPARPPERVAAPSVKDMPTVRRAAEIPVVEPHAPAREATPSARERLIEENLSPPVLLEETGDMKHEEFAGTVAPFPGELAPPSTEVQPGPEVDFFAEASAKFREGDQEAALNLFCKAATGGNGAAMYTLGMMYELGLGAPVNLEKARGWYLRAARKHKSGDAMNSLGLLYQHGEGVIAQSAEKARFWFRLAVRHGSEEAAQNQQRFAT